MGASLAQTEAYPRARRPKAEKGDDQAAQGSSSKSGQAQAGDRAPGGSRADPPAQGKEEEGGGGVVTSALCVARRARREASKGRSPVT